MSPVHAARAGLAVSWTQAPPTRLRAAAALLADGVEPHRRGGEGWQLSWVPVDGVDPADPSDPADAADAEGGPTQGRTVLALQRETRGLSGRLDAAGVDALIDREPDPAWSVQPPCSLLVADHGSGAVRAITDQIGFGHLYLARGRGWAAASTSARALGALLGGALDPDTWGLQTLLGWQAGNGSAFAGGATKLAAGSSATLTQGRLELSAPPRLLPDGEFDGALDQAVERAAGIVRRGVEQALDDHPDLLLQLTGGLDSRILLAAVPPARRADVSCLTLVVPGSPDAELASGLTRRFGMLHHVVTLDAVTGLAPDEAHLGSLRAARRIDAASDPLAFAVLERVEGELAAVPRLSGLGGEVVRGFYYVPAPLRGLTRDRKVARLAAWRLFPNEEVPDAVIHPRLREHRRDDAVRRLRRIFAAYPREWNAATDHFYLGQRMQRWAGLLASATSAERVVVNPMLDPEFLALGTSLPTSWKANAQFLSRILVALDPQLADIPLDGRPSPSVYAFPGLRSRATFGALTARKVVGKVSQRLTSSGRAAAGDATLADLVVEAWRADPALVSPARELGIVDPAWLDAVIAGAPASSSGVGLVVDLLAAAEAVVPAG